MRSFSSGLWEAQPPAPFLDSRRRRRQQEQEQEQPPASPTSRNNLRLAALSSSEAFRGTL